MAAADKFQVVFSPSGKRGQFLEGTSVLEAARSLGVDVDSICGGRGICGRCQVDVTDGDLARHGIASRAQHLTPVTEAEERYGKRRRLATGRRLSCQAGLCGDVAIDVPASSQVHRQVVRKPHEACDIDIDPITRAYFLDVEKPDMHMPSGDAERLVGSLQRDWDLGDLDIALPVVAAMQSTLRAADWRVTVAVRNGREIIAIWPGLRERLYGVAVDVGSTTVAAHLCDLASGEVMASAGMMNPQIRFGEDLMSRVSYVMENPGSRAELTGAVRDAINELLAETAAEAGIDTGDIVEMTIVGNPIMLHLVLGLDPTPLGTAPFALATDGATTVRAVDLDLHINPGGYAYALPCIAGHVGADTAGVLLAEAPFDREDISLIVDVGTNAELLIGNRETILAASSPTGPAFEGAQISSGQRAAPGATERVRVDPETLEPRYKVIGSELWSDEDGFADGLPASGVTGICGSGIIEIIGELYLAGVIGADGKIQAAAAGRSDRVVKDGRTFTYVLVDGEPGVTIRQSDIRAIQLAKAALSAGARLLMERLGVDKVDRVRLAGAFGTHLDVRYAQALGMIPDCELENVSSAGNAAGTGARIALLNKAARETIERQTRESRQDRDGRRGVLPAILHRSPELPPGTVTVSVPGTETVTVPGWRESPDICRYTTNAVSGLVTIMTPN